MHWQSLNIASPQAKWSLGSRFGWTEAPILASTTDDKTRGHPSIPIMNGMPCLPSHRATTFGRDDPAKAIKFSRVRNIAGFAVVFIRTGAQHKALRRGSSIAYGVMRRFCRITRVMHHPTHRHFPPTRSSPTGCAVLPGRLCHIAALPPASSLSSRNPAARKLAPPSSGRV